MALNSSTLCEAISRWFKALLRHPNNRKRIHVSVSAKPSGDITTVGKAGRTMETGT